MANAKTTQGMSLLTRIIAAVAVGMVVLAGLGWWLAGSRVWTDDRAIRLPDGAVRIREILWTRAQPLEQVLGGESVFNTKEDEFEPSLSPDGAELFFVRTLPSRGGGFDADLFMSRRENNRWSRPQRIKALSTAANELGPRLAPDGDTLYFYSDRDGGHGGYDLWMSRRTADGWGEPANLGPTINTPDDEFSPAPSPDGQRIFFTSNRNAPDELPETERWNPVLRDHSMAIDTDLFVAQRQANESALQFEFSQAAAVTPLNTGFHESAASISPAGDFLYFTSNRDGASRGLELFRSRLRPADAAGVDPNDPRICTGILIESPEKLAQLNTAGDESDAALTMEGFRLLYSSNMPTGQGGYDLYLSDSREVFVDRDQRTLPAVGLTWIVLAAAVALLLFLLFLFGKLDSEKLGMLQRCLIVSLFIHLILTIVLSFFWISKEVYENVAKVNKEMRIALNLEAAAEIDVRMAARSQRADLPVTTPTVGDSQRQPTPMQLAQSTAPREVSLDIPAASKTPDASSMILPASPKQTPAPAPTITATSAALPATVPLPPTAQPQSNPLTPVTATSTPSPATPSEASRQAAATPATSTAQSSEAQATPAKAEAQSTATSAAAARAAVRAESTRSDVAAPSPMVVNPAPAASFNTQQVKAAQPAAKSASDQPTAAPQRAQAANSSAAEASPSQAPPTQAASQSLASSASNPQSAAKPTAESMTTTASAAPPSAVPVPSSTAAQTKPVRSTLPDGIAVAEATTAVAQRTMTRPASEAGSVEVEAPPARSQANAQAATATASAAKATAAAAAAPSSEPQLPVNEPGIDTQRATASRIQAAEAAAPTATAAPSSSLTGRVEMESNATTAAEAGSAAPSATPSKPSAQSLASADAAARSTASTAERVQSQPQSLIAPELELGASSITGKPMKSQASSPLASSSEAAPSSEKSTAQPSPATQASSAATQNTSDALAPTKSDGKSLLAASTEASRAAASAKSPASASTPNLPLMDVPFQLESHSFSKSDKPAVSDANPRENRPESSSPALAKSKTGRTPANTADTRSSSDDLIAPSADNTRSLTGKLGPADLRARSASASRAQSTDVVLLPLNEPLGPGKFAAPAPLFQRAPEMREKLLKDLGGTPESEDAVSRALAYLSRNQEPDGRWTFVMPTDKGPGRRSVYQHDMALTALAVLTFLGADHTPVKPGPYREQLVKAIDYLLKHAEKNGDCRGDGNMYDQGIVAIALAETALMTGDTRTREAALAAARFISGAQDRNSGGWRYKPGEYGDTSVLGWQIMAMHSAEQLGFVMEKKIREGSERWLDMVTQKKSLVSGYQQEGPRPSMTAEAVFTRILLGQTFDDRQIRTFEEYMFENPAGKGDADYYYLYYATLSFNQLQGTNWPRWNEKTRDYLVKQQRRGGADDGSWNVVNRWDRKGGQVYTTCLAALTLEVYYRYLPMYGGPKRVEK